TARWSLTPFKGHNQPAKQRNANGLSKKEAQHYSPAKWSGEGFSQITRNQKSSVSQRKDRQYHEINRIMKFMDIVTQLVYRYEKGQQHTGDSGMYTGIKNEIP